MYQTEILADMLVQRPLFRTPSKGDFQQGRFYSIFLNVPVKCLTVKNAEQSIAGNFANYFIDLLICRGREAVQAIVLDAEYRNMEALFSNYLTELPYLFLQSDELTNELASGICNEIEVKLSSDQSTPLHTGCFLYFVLAVSVIFRIEDPSIREQAGKKLRSYLWKKHLADKSGTVTPYGRACGIFCQCLKGKKRIYITSLSTREDLKQALLWNGACLQGDSLAQRLQRVKRDLPGGSSSCRQAASAVKQLLSTPLEKLFANHPTERSQLSHYLNLARAVPCTYPAAAFAGKDNMETYGDVICAVRNLRESAGAYSDGDVESIFYACKMILANLSVPLLASPEQSRTCASLRTRLQQTQPGQSELLACTMPLSFYFYGAACLEQSEYPLWLFRSRIRFDLNFSKVPAQNWNLRKAVQYADKLRQSEDENEEADYFYVIYDLLVEPVGRIAG